MAGLVYISGVYLKSINHVVWLCITPVLASISYLAIAKLFNIMELSALIFRLTEFIKSSK
jgi:hypothetical protein